MMPVVEIRIVYRCRLFYWLRKFLPKKCVLDIRHRGKIKRKILPINKPVNIGRGREIRPVRLRDAIAFIVMIKRKKA